MTDAPLNPIDYASAEESLRQERDTFDHLKRQSDRWFLLRLIVGYASVFSLVAILVLCAYIILNAARYPTVVLSSAVATLFGDLVGLLAAIWKVVINPGSAAALKPVTTRRLSTQANAAKKKGGQNGSQRAASDDQEQQ